MGANRFASPVLLSAVLSLASACTPEESPIMKPGQDCISCHRKGGEAEAYSFSAAGTVFPKINSISAEGVQGVKVLLKDALGKELALTTNASGNFYTSESLTPPIAASLEYNGKKVAMFDSKSPHQIYADVSKSPGLGCNGCHSGPPTRDVNVLPDGGHGEDAYYVTPVGGAPGRLTLPENYPPSP